jgi:hypothetical protein
MSQLISMPPIEEYATMKTGSQPEKRQFLKKGSVISLSLG